MLTNVCTLLFAFTVDLIVRNQQNAAARMKQYEADVSDSFPSAPVGCLAFSLWALGRL
jgi:hypothetical protein